MFIIVSSVHGDNLSPSPVMRNLSDILNLCDPPNTRQLTRIRMCPVGHSSVQLTGSSHDSAGVHFQNESLQQEVDSLKDKLEEVTLDLQIMKEELSEAASRWSCGSGN